jgi:tetratricopeptide (TPR) repeat protein
VAGLETLKTARPARLAETLAAGREALGDDDGDAAQRYFEQALLIDTDNEEAQTGLARARVRSRVLQFMAAGAQAEDARQLQAARAAYQQALQLDAVFAAAQQGLTRVEAALAARSFNAAMNEALAALAEGRFDAAGAALDRAATIDPYATAMVDTRERLRLARQQAAVDALRRDAAARAQAEDWLGAVERYRRVLKIDAAAGFAREGVARAEQRAKLNRQFDHYLDDPTRLFSAEPLANAEQLLDTAGEAPTDEPRLASKIESLRVLVRQARQPLPVMLQSDGETDVVIYHVGRLGRFVDRRLQLPPGTYTAVGSRTGYRDVRRMFEVRPGQLPSTVEIRCEEPV